MEDFSFHIADVLDCLGIQHPGPVKNAVYIECPNPNCACKGKKKLHVVYSEDFARCAACGMGGGMLAFARDVLGVSTKSEAAKEIASRLGRVSDDWKNQLAQKHEKVKKEATEWESKRAPLADIETRNTCYTEYLSLLSLSPKHEENLLNRGFSKEAIERLGYKSVPTYGKTIIPKMLKQKEVPMDGVPLFYYEKDTPCVNIGKKSGFYIKIKDFEDRIIGMQIRYDVVTGNAPRYMYATSWSDHYMMERGSTLRDVPKIHHVGFDEGKKQKHIPKVIITEGPLKGDCAHFLGFQLPFLCICGLSNYNGLYEELEMLKSEYGLEEVYDFTDMDKFDRHFKTGEILVDGKSKPVVVKMTPEQFSAQGIPAPLDGFETVEIDNPVRVQTDKIFQKVEAMGLKVVRYKWPREYKGCDDYALYLKNKKKGTL